MAEFSLSLLIGLIQVGILALIAAVIPLGLLALKKSKRLAAGAFALCLAAVLCGAAALATHPVWSCPEEYAGYVSREEKDALLRVNSGIYSPQVPIFAAHVRVLYADETSVRVRTDYLFWGSTEMVLTDGDGFSLTKPLTGL